MEKIDRKKHWEHIYKTKQLQEVSWFEPVPHTSLDFIKQLNVPKSAKIIDIGGGDSFLVDYLIELGYNQISVLDISAAAIARAKQRLGKQAQLATWIVADITEFDPSEKYDVWHDRAAFHFLTDNEERKRYVQTAHSALRENGAMILGTFSPDGPKKCSGIDIMQYDASDLEEQMSPEFEMLTCTNTNHNTPFNTTQNFTFCRFKKV